MNTIIRYIILLLCIIVSSIFYIGASYYFRYGEQNNIKFIYIYIISIIFGIISYSIKIPAFHYLGKDISIMMINIFFLTISFIIVIFYSIYILNEKIPIYTYIISILIVLLIILNNILEYEYKIKLKNKNI
jgi:uncharacterized protein (DUF486 family)